MHTGEKFNMPLAMASGYPLIDFTFFNINTWLGAESNAAKIQYRKCLLS